LSLQDKINHLETYDTLVLDFDEYFEKIVIDKPLTLDGGGSTLCFPSGPVVTVHAQDVTLRNICLEVTSGGEIKDKIGSLALRVKDNTPVRLQNVSVKGDVKGVVGENGLWHYPDVLNIHPVAPYKTNYFVFEMDVPVSCALETDIEDLRIINPALSPGLNRVLIQVSNLNKDTILFGQIGIQSTYLKRIISISGGSFGIPDDIAAPVKAKPVPLNSLDPSLKKQTPARPEQRSDAGGFEGEEHTLFKITNYDFQQYKQYLKIGAVLLLIFICIFAYVILPKSPSDNKNGKTPTPVPTAKPALIVRPTSLPTSAPTQPANIDTIKPQGKLSGIKNKYNISDQIRFRIEGKDNHALRKMGLEVKNANIQKYGYVAGTENHFNGIFSTNDLSAGLYNYTYFVEDASGNEFRENGHFYLERQEGWIDIVTEPSGVEIHIEGQYIGRTPMRNFKYGAGKIKMKFIDHYYGINETRIIHIEPGQNSIKNIKLPIDYGYLAINTTPPTKMTIYGREIGWTPKARLKLPAGQKTIRFVNKEFNIDTTKDVLIEAGRTIPKNFNFFIKK